MFAPYIELQGPAQAVAPTSRLRHYQNVSSAIYLFAARVLAAVVQLRVVENIWGAQYSGLNALSNQVLLYITLLELGLAQSAISLLYEPIVGRRQQEVSAFVLAVRHDVRRFAAIGALAVMPLVGFYATMVRSAVPLSIVLTTLELVAVSGLIQLAAVHFQVYLNAAEGINRINYVLGTGYLVKTATGLAIAVKTRNYLWLPVVIVLLTVGEFVALKIAFHRFFPEFQETPWREAATAVRRKARFVLIHKIAGLAYYQSDFIILSLTTSLVVVKNYAEYQYISGALLSMFGMVATSLTASLARHQLGNTADNRRKQYLVSQRATCLIAAVVMLGFWFTSRTVVTAAFGPNLAVGVVPIVLFGVALFLNIVKTTDDTFIIAKGAFEIGYWLPILEAPAYMILAILLSERLGFSGIIIASILSNLIVPVVAKGLVLAQPVFESTRFEWFSNRVGNIVIGLLVASPVALLYWLSARFPGLGMARLLAVNGLAAMYALLIAKRILMQGFEEAKGR